ncbi:glycerophosphodiester phosphodiesterase [Clostridium sp. chh4-2]|uniref:glycerophosphodiester phosphodiesterase n=1 Tax=Clostridium sp. chh4-2 TaxID=2067550 RepID=UPI000CCE5401|nr:glycerophosphodiester phosphodiesterase [Clostridium sp. chh4-2]PNV63181.1 glycerophosphodiester phosphodiesterase [Clostridium sp. chh4-2]
MKTLLEQADRVLIGGHRGCSCEYPENSIAAMAEGRRQGADYLEIDIQLTKDRVPVVFHDVRLETKTDLSGYVHDFDLQELKDHVPGLCTLKEAMEWGCLRDAYFALELKSVPIDMHEINKELIDLMLPVIKTTGMIRQVFLFGADYQILRYAKEKNPKLQIGLIVPFVPADPVELMRSMDALVYLSYIYNMTPEIIRDLKEHGYYVSGAILREEKWVRRAVELGVTMFESDYPGKAI